MPEGRRFDVELELRYYDTQMPLHTVVEYGAARSAAGDPPVSRHIIRIYDTERREVASAVVTDAADNATLPRRHTFSLPAGRYTAACWTDCAEQDGADLYYDTSAFPDVELRCAPDADGFSAHCANTLRRDAFNGSAAFGVAPDGRITCGADAAEAECVPVPMRRPMARYVLEATDFEEFADRLATKAGTAAELLADYLVAVRYDGYMPSVFSVQTDALVDSRVGASFSGEPRFASDGSGTVELGSDYVFVNPLETSVRVAVEVRNAATGETVARAGPFTVPLLRNRLTVVRGRFLTSRSGSGVTIDPGFEGDYDIEIK